MGSDCDVCKDFLFEYCSTHGGPLVVADAKVPRNSNPQRPRAELTAPLEYVYIAKSTIPDAGLGVFAKKALVQGLRFGPYRGQRIDKNIGSNYCWEIQNAAGQATHSVDASDEERSNWLRYVNCARHTLEQNISAYQYKGQIYYRTHQFIPQDAELLVFYGKKFAAQLKIQIGNYHKAEIQQIRSYKNTEVKQIENNNKSEIYHVNKELDQTHDTPIGRLPKPVRLTSADLNKKQGFVIGMITMCGYFDEKNKSCDDDSDDSFGNIIQSLEEESRNEKAVENAKPDDIEKRKLSDRISDAVNNSCKEDSYDQQIINIHDSDDQTDFSDSSVDIDGLSVKSDDFSFHTGYDSDSQNDMELTKKPTEESSEANTKLDKNAIKHYECNICHKTLQSRDKLRWHKRIHGGAQKFNCTLCNYKTNVKYYYSRHQQSHKPKLYKRQKKALKDKKAVPQGFNPKVMETTNKPSWQCDECNNSFSTRSYLRYHKRMHGGLYKFKCTSCAYQTDIIYYFDKHMKSSHPSKAPLQKCSQCTFKSINKKVFAIHVGLHTNKKAIKCEMCDYLCTQKRYLHAHLLRVHVATKRYQCEVCPSAFNCSEYLRKHITHVHACKDGDSI